MPEHIDSLKREAFGRLDQEDLRRQKEQLMFARRTSNHEANHKVTCYGALGTMHTGICR
jgi:hypothetical protein